MGTVKYSGPVASFHCPTEATIRSLKVHFSPKQAGSGNPSPENVRPIEGWDGVEVYKTGKNLIDINSLTGTSNVWWNGNVVSGYPNHCVTPKISVQPKKQYHLYRNSEAQNYVSEFDINGNYLRQTIRGTDTSFIIPDDVYFLGITISTDYKDEAQLELGSTATSYEPYHGSITNYEFGVLGKNKFDPNCDMWDYSVYSKNGDEITQTGSDGRGWTDANLKSISLKAGTYTLTCSDENNFNLRTSIDNYEANISLINGGGSFTLSQDCDVKIKHSVKSGNSYPTTFTVQLELGSTATAYEPYDPNKTVYGGYVDVVTGELVAEYGIKQLTSADYIFNTYTYENKNGISIANVLDNTAQRIQGYCTHTPIMYQTSPGVWSASSSDTFMWLGVSNRYVYWVGILDDLQLSTVDEFKNWLDTQNVYIAWKLVTPITYHLPPTTMQTFLSHNNIWSNADYVEVEYDLHETQNILARKQFIMAGQPHVVNPAAASLQNFETDMVAPLKECKVYFEPKQDLNGYSKPWVGGTGKNLFNINVTEQNPDDMTAANTTIRNFTAGTYCVGTSWSNWLQPNQVLEHSVSDGVLSIKNNNVYGIGYVLKIEPETNYAISATASGGGIHAAFYDASGNFISGLSTNLLNTSFATPVDATLIVLTFYNRSEGSDATTATFSNIQFEKGSSVTSYEPWENICPIEGWNSIEVGLSHKNLLDTTKNNRTTHPIFSTENGIVNCSSVTAWNSTHIWFTQVFPAGTYTISCDYSGTGSNGPRFICSASIDGGTWNTSYQGYWKNFTGRSCTFTASESFSVALVFISRNDHNGESCTFYNIQLEKGSNATEYKPYYGEQIPITFPSVINMLSSTIITANKTLSSAGEETSENGMSITNYIKVNESDTYKLTFTSKEGARTRRIYGYDANKDIVDSLASTSWVSVDTIGSIQATIPSGVEYIRVCYKTADENIFLEGPESSVIYGGYVDLVNEEIIQTHYLAKVTKTQFGNITESSSNGILYRQTSPDFDFPVSASGTDWNLAREQQLFNRGKIANPWSETNFGSNIGVFISQNNYNMHYVRISEDIYQTLGDNDYVEISYLLAEPIHYPIDPQTLKTLRGTNNIWSNTNGPIELSYWKH